jgi:hypothetical protein
MTNANPADLNDPNMKWVVALAQAFKAAGATHSPIEPEPDIILRCLNGISIGNEVLSWLGFWRDQLPVDAVKALQRIVARESQGPRQGDK